MLKPVTIKSNSSRFQFLFISMISLFFGSNWPLKFFSILTRLSSDEFNFSEDRFEVNLKFERVYLFRIWPCDDSKNQRKPLIRHTHRLGHESIGRQVHVDQSSNLVRVMFCFGPKKALNTIFSKFSGLRSSEGLKVSMVDTNLIHKDL